MYSTNKILLSMSIGDDVKCSKLLNLFVCSFTLSSVQDQIPVPIPFGIIYFLPIVSTLLEMMGSISSVKISSF